MTNITDKVVTAWYNCYVRNENEDPHAEFAKSIGVSRIEAKKTCYVVAYNIMNTQTMRNYL